MHHSRAEGEEQKTMWMHEYRIGHKREGGGGTSAQVLRIYRVENSRELTVE